MIITEILNILNIDNTLSTLLGATASDTKIYPFSTAKMDNSITYIVTPILDEDVKRTDRVEIHIVSKDLSNAHAIDNRVRTLLKTLGDTPNGNFLQVSINGGGSLEDIATETYHLITYYYITQRSN